MMTEVDAIMVGGYMHVMDECAPADTLLSMSTREFVTDDGVSDDAQRYDNAVEPARARVFTNHLLAG